MIGARRTTRQIHSSLTDSGSCFALPRQAYLSSFLGVRAWRWQNFPHNPRQWWFEASAVGGMAAAAAACRLNKALKDETLQLYRACWRTARACPTLGGRLQMETYARCACCCHIQRACRSLCWERQNPRRCARGSLYTDSVSGPRHLWKALRKARRL